MFKRDVWMRSLMTMRMAAAMLVALTFGRLTSAVADAALGKAADNAIYAMRAWPGIRNWSLSGCTP
jgi:hypothetical protein